MATLTGREILVGLKKASTWRTAVAAGVNDGLLILSEGVRQTLEHIDDDSLGLAFIQRTSQGKIEASGSLELYMRYEGLDVLIALIMGTAGIPAQPNPLYTSVYKHSYVLADNLNGLFATLAILKKSDKVFEYPSVKFHQFSFSGEMNAPVKLTVEGIANRLELASVINTAATMVNITYPDKSNRIIVNKDAYIRLNDESGAALASGDAIYPASFELTFNRPMDASLVIGNKDVDEPVGEGFPEITLTLNFPRYNDANHAFFMDWESFTRKKMEIYLKGHQFTAPAAPADWVASTVYAVDDCVKPTTPNSLWYKCTAAGTSGTLEPAWPTTVGETVTDGTATWGCMEDEYWYEFRIQFPNLKIVDPEAAVTGPGKIPVSLSFKVLGTDTAPTGMPGITKPFQIDIQNKRATDPLA